MEGAALARSEALEYLRHATGYDADRVLQELVDDVRSIFGTDLCIVHLMLPGSMYFRAWSGDLPHELAESKVIPKEMSMCPPVAEGASPLVVEDLSEAQEYRDHSVCKVGGMRFYAGTPLATAEGTTIGTLCLMDHEPKAFTGDELKTLQAFGRAVVGRIETLGALGRERSAREEDRRSREVHRVLEGSMDIIAIVGLDGTFRTINRACKAVVGYEPEELVGRAYDEFVHPADKSRLREATRRLFRGEPVVGFQGRHLRKGGGVVWVEWNATALPEEDVFYCVARDITARKRAEEELRHGLDLLGATMRSLGEGVYTVDSKGCLTSLNPAAERMLGWPEEKFLGRHMHEAIHYRHVDGTPLSSEQCPLLEVLRSGVVYRDDRDYFIRRDGTAFPVSCTSSPIERDGEISGAVVAFSDDTERRRAKEELRRQMDLYETLLETQSAVGEGLVMIEGQEIVYANEAFCRISGYEKEELEKLPSLFELVPEDNRQDAQEKLRRKQGGEQGEGYVETVLLHKSGRRVDLEAAARMLQEDLGRLIVVARDITEHKALEEKLEHQAFHDGLTGLPNRALFFDRLRQALNRTGRRHDSVAVLFLDLDGFKNINDSLGHEVGDALLVATARRIEQSVRLADTVARLGGDEFTILLEDVTGVEEAVVVADRIAAELSRPFELCGEEVLITSSIGISITATAQDLPEELMRDADLAMYRAKETGKAHHRIFEENMGVEARNRLELASELRRTIDGEEFRIYYQPLMMLDREGSVAGMEALLRWEHPDHGLLTPPQFLPVAEETGLILPIGLWVLEEACVQASSWREEQPNLPPPMLCVNLSAKQMQAPGLVEEVAWILERTGLPPGSLNLEIPGDLLVGDAGALASRLRELKDLGVKLTVDDLGGQGAALSLPRRLPVDFLKIDRSVIDGLGRNPEDAAVVSAFIGLADAFGIGVIAEGIENEDQISRLRRMGCKLGQGYHFSLPLPGLEASRFQAIRVP